MNISPISTCDSDTDGGSYDRFLSEFNLDNTLLHVNRFLSEFNLDNSLLHVNRNH